MNHRKSFDHNGRFDFKKQDEKNLRDKALLKEIKDISTKECNEDEALLSFFSQSKISSNPHLKLEFPDPEIHEDLYNIVGYWCGSIGTPANKLLKILKIWTTFLEPMLRVSLVDAEDSEDDIEDNDHVSENEDETNRSEVHSIIPSSPINIAADVTMGSSEVSECPMGTAKPLAKLVPPELQDEREKDSEICYGNDSLYLLFRLHHTLYERIESVKIVSSAADKRLNTVDEKRPINRYARFKSKLFNLFDGKSGNAKFVDDCCAFLGAQDSFVLFSLDKLVDRLVTHLESISMNEIDNRLLELYSYEKLRKGGRFIDRLYHENAGILLRNENLYRIECSFEPTRMSIQLMDNSHYKSQEPALPMDPDFEFYLHHDFLSAVPDKKEKRGVYLKRNKKKSAAGDGSNAMEGLKIINGLEHTLSCFSFKVTYVPGTEDVLFRKKKKKF